MLVSSILHFLLSLVFLRRKQRAIAWARRHAPTHAHTPARDAQRILADVNERSLACLPPSSRATHTRHLFLLAVSHTRGTQKVDVTVCSADRLYSHLSFDLLQWRAPYLELTLPILQPQHRISRFNFCLLPSNSANIQRYKPTELERTAYISHSYTQTKPRRRQLTRRTTRKKLFSLCRAPPLLIASLTSTLTSS